MIADFEWQRAEHGGFWRGLLALSLYGMGCARFTDIVPGGLASKSAAVARASRCRPGVSSYMLGAFATCTYQKTGCERARWRICLFDESALHAYYDVSPFSRFDDIAVLDTAATQLDSACICRPETGIVLRVGGCASRAIRTGAGYRSDCTPYSFKHLRSVVAAKPLSTSRVSTHCPYSISSHVNVGHIDWNRTSVQIYGIFDVCVEQQHTTPFESRPDFRKWAL